MTTFKGLGVAVEGTHKPVRQSPTLISVVDGEKKKKKEKYNGAD